MEFPFKNPEQFGDVRTIAERAGVLLHGDDGQPFHHERRMTVGSGLFGPDIAKCECGLEMVNMASPHLNGGFIFNEDVLEQYGDRMWTFSAPEPVERE